MPNPNRQVATVVLALSAGVAMLSGAAPLAAAELGGSRIINLPGHLTVGASTLELVFTHRFSQTVGDAGGTELFGLDSAADVGIGLALGLGPRLQVEVYRSSFFKQIEAAAKLTLARQGAGRPLGLAVRAGTDYRGAAGVEQRWSGFVQAICGRTFGDTLSIWVVPMFASDTPTLENAANLGLAGVLHLRRRWDLAAEAIAANRDARDGEVAWSVGLVKRVPGHEFLVYVGNSRATTTDLMVGSDLPGGYGAGDVRLGFNLVRRFPE